MPYSLRDNEADVLAYVQMHGIKTVLDVGAGAGAYGRLLREAVDGIDAIEIHEPYVERFGLREIYRQVLILDVRSRPRVIGPRYDLVIFGDVLEHLSEAEAISVWDWAHDIAEHGLVSVPVGHWPQGAEEGNEHEAHVQEDLDEAAVQRLFGPFFTQWLYERTMTGIRRFA